MYIKIYGNNGFQQETNMTCSRCKHDMVKKPSNKWMLVSRIREMI